MDDADAGTRRRESCSLGRSQGVFHVAQVTNYANVDVAPAGLPGRVWLGNRLENDAKFFSKLLWNDAPSQTVQCNKAVGQLHRAQCRSGFVVYVMVDIGAAELENERPLGIADLKAATGLGAAPRMNRDHCV